MASPTGEGIVLLIKKAQKEASVFLILGDLFDLWLGQGDYFKKEYASLLEEFKKLKQTCRLIYFEGNHDLHLKKFWEQELGFEVYVEPQMFDFDGMKVWAEHGDEINRGDRDYLFLRWFLRTKPMEYLIYNLSSKISGFIGEKASGLSRGYTGKIENQSKEIFRRYAMEKAQTQKFDLMLLGHTHVVDDFSFKSMTGSNRLINLGSWLEKPCYLEFSSKDDLKVSEIPVS